MGGFGSGRREYADTPTVEECRHLDVDDLTELTERTGATGAVRWGDPDDPAATIAIRAEGDAGLEDAARPDAVRLTYTVTNTRTEESQEYDEPIPLEYTECHFGGYRPWFRCPGCRERRGKVYLPPGGERFRCRECYDLGYRSSRTSGDDVKQAELRYRRAFAKADAEDRRPHPNNLPHLPDRPKGMHQETFAELTSEVREARREWHEEMEKRTRELLNNFSSPGEDHRPDPTE